MNKKVAFLTTVFPMDKAYLYDFFNSLQKQTYKNFDVIVVNDGYANLKEFIREFKDLNIIELQHSDTPAKNREYGIDYVTGNNYDILIFGDSDDYFDTNRVQLSVDILNDYDIVVNDLTLFNDEQGVYLKKYISNRVKDCTNIKLDFIEDKNIFGLSNTAVNVSALDNIHFDKDLIAVDWYLYSTLLLRNKKAIFTNKTITYYRQYANNTIGIGSKSIDTVLKGIAVKNKHYSLLKKEDNVFTVLHENILELKKRVGEKNGLEELSTQNIKNPLWWEEIKLIKEGKSI